MLDINMPGLSGLEVLPELLKYSQDLAVILMSGFAEVDTAVYVAARQRFYHGRMDGAREQQLRREVVAGLIDRLLLIKAARARAVVVDEAAKQQLYKQMLARYNVAALPQDHRKKIEIEVIR